MSRHLLSLESIGTYTARMQIAGRFKDHILKLMAALESIRLDLLHTGRDRYSLQKTVPVKAGTADGLDPGRTYGRRNDHVFHSLFNAAIDQLVIGGHPVDRFFIRTRGRIFYNDLIDIKLSVVFLVQELKRNSLFIGGGVERTGSHRTVHAAVHALKIKCIFHCIPQRRLELLKGKITEGTS